MLERSVQKAPMASRMGASYQMDNGRSLCINCTDVDLRALNSRTNAYLSHLKDNHGIISCQLLETRLRQLFRNSSPWP